MIYFPRLAVHCMVINNFNTVIPPENSIPAIICSFHHIIEDHIYFKHIYFGNKTVPLPNKDSSRSFECTFEVRKQDLQRCDATK